MATDINQTETRKDNKVLIYGLLVAALLGTWGYIVYDKSKTKEQVSSHKSKNYRIENMFTPETDYEFTGHG